MATNCKWLLGEDLRSNEYILSCRCGGWSKRIPIDWTLDGKGTEVRVQAIWAAEHKAG